MYNDVSKVLVGAGSAIDASLFDETQAADPGKVMVMDAFSQGAVTSATTEMVFAMTTAVAGSPILSAPIKVGSIRSSILNSYRAPGAQVMTLTVDTVPDAGTASAIFRVSYDDSLGIIPNQVKQTFVAIEPISSESTSAYATRIAAAFNAEEFKFVTVTVATNVVTFTAKTLLTASAYNSIDRPETVVFNVGMPIDGEQGEYTLAQTSPPYIGQGTPSQIAWLEDRHQGRRGYSDRRMWNDNKKFSTSVDSSETYDQYIINAWDEHEGDLQTSIKTPTGVILALEVGTYAALKTTLDTVVLPVVAPTAQTT